MSAQSREVLTITITATGTITASRFMTIAGAQAGADAAAIGVSKSDAVSGDLVPCVILGTAVVEAGAAIAAGATLKSDASGRAITWATSGSKLGIALQAASAAGELIEALLYQPNV